MSQALYYPWIDIRDEAWLKTALLYWDSVRTIVPESINAPYSTETGQALQEAEFLVPLHVHSGMHEIEELAGDVLTYLASAEGAEILLAGHARHKHSINIEKLPYELGRFANIHPEKLPYELHHIVHEFATNISQNGDWLLVDEKFASFYMTLLASRLADRVGAQLLTSFPAANKLAVSARFDAQLNGVLPRGMHLHMRHRPEYEAYGPRHRMPRHLAPGMLANLAIERINIAPDTPVMRLLKFREKHRDELGQFRTMVEQLASSIETDLSAEALQQRVSNIYSNDIVPAISNLKAALRGRRIKWLGQGLLKIGFLSVGSSTMLTMAGLDSPTALLAGAGISLVAEGVRYNEEKRESIRSNPFAYLLSLERELA